MIDERRHSVLLRGQPVGVLHHRGDVVRFSLNEEYWADPGRDVLGLWFENNPGTSPKAALRLPVWFSNLLPEGRLREWIAADRGVSVMREMELLLRVGHDLPGAVEIVEDGATFASTDLGNDLEDVRPRESDKMTWKFSLAGVGLKFSMLRQGDRLTIPAAQEVGDWIVKLPDAQHAHVPLNEFVMMRLAALVGISVPETRMVDRAALPDLPDAAWPGDENVAYAVSRFDRTANGSKIHIEDFAQVRGFYPEDKYLGAFETVGALSYRGQDVTSLQEFVRRLTFSLLIGNGDAHLKNWSLIYRDGRTATLSPAYDLVSTAPYMIATNEDLGLKFGGTRHFERVTWRDFKALEEKLNARGADLAGVAEDTVNRFESAWSSFEPIGDDLRFVETWISSHLGGAQRRLLA